jgi:GLPGLI family protein
MMNGNKSWFVLTIFVLFTGLTKAQTYKFTYIVYEDSASVYESMINLGYSDEDAKNAVYDKNYKSWYSVYCRDGQSQMRFDSVVHADRNYPKIEKIKRRGSASHIVYHDFKNNLLYRTDDSIFLNKVTYKKEDDSKWDFSDKTIYQINGFKCRKAKSESSTSDISIWYSIEMPIQSGMGGALNLPGLIIQSSELIQMVAAKNITKLMKIELLKDDMEILPSKTRLFIPFEEFDKGFYKFLMSRLGFGKPAGK